MSVKVAIRVRPFNQRQKFLGCTACVEMKGNTTVVHENRGKQKKQHYFTFDYSFWSHDGFQQKQNGLLVRADQTYVDQERVYGLLGQQILENAWVGFNCCLFAYGQTGAGKSYSMIGYGANKGIIPKACQQLFQRIRRFQKKGQRQYEVTISMLQIYNQKVQDLFISTNKRPLNGLKVRQNKALGVYVQGLNKFPVFSYAQIQKKMDDGSKNRSLASTLMNEYSSRAHTIVMLEFIQKEWITDKKMSKKTSLINLVDLAGSQRVSKTGVGDNKDRLKEASLINKSLHTLGRVIEALAEQSNGKIKNIAVPYRQSALTRILENALGGNSKTTMICAISPANDNCEQTLSTLRYADKTKKIKNKPVVNESQVDKLIRQLRQENDRLKKLLQAPQEERSGPLQGLITSQMQSQRKQMKSNVRASMRQIQKQIRKNLQSFAINTEQIIKQVDNQQSLMMTQFVDLENPSVAEFQASFTSTTGKSQAFITNLNQDQILNFKVKYSCQNNLLITNKNKKEREKGILQDVVRKVVLCGLGIEENHAKIIKEDGRFFIEALSQAAMEYTLLNGKPVTSKQQLKHNDRIILGTNSVFLFKNLERMQQRPNKKYSNQRTLRYEFATNQRQQQLQEEGSEHESSGSPLRRRGASMSGQQEDKQLLNRLQYIQVQFSRMIEQNQLKTREKEQRFRHKLVQLQRQKQLREVEREKLQSRLTEKKQQTYRLRTRELEIQKLQGKLAKFQGEKKKRKAKRESMLLDGVNINDEDYDHFFEGQFVDLQQPDKIKPHKQSRVHTNQNQKDNHKLTHIHEEQDLLQQQNQISALGMIRTNPANPNQSSLQKVKKNGNTYVPVHQFLTEAEQIENYNKIVKVYLDKIRHRMTSFTKIYDFTIFPQKLTIRKEEQMKEFNCQTNGGFHFCRHCKKVINKVEYISYNQNKYEYNQAQKHSQKGQNIINLNRSNLSDLFKHQTQKSRNRSGSQNINDQSLLLNGSAIQFQQNQKTTRKRYGSQSNSNYHPSLSQIPQALLQQSRRTKINNSDENANIYPSKQMQIPNNDLVQDLDDSGQQRNVVSSKNKKSQMSFFSFGQQDIEENFQYNKQFTSSNKQIQIPQSSFAKQYLKNNHQQANLDSHVNQYTQAQENKKSSLELYISHQNIYEPKSPKMRIHSQIISIKNVSSEITAKVKPSFSDVQIQTEIMANEGSLRDSSLQVKAKTQGLKQPNLGVDFDFSGSDIEEDDHENSVQQSLIFSSLNTFKEQQLTSQIQLLKQKIHQLQNQSTSPQKDKQATKVQFLSQQNDNNNIEQQFACSTQKTRHILKKYSQKDRVPQLSSQEQAQPTRRPIRQKRLTQLPSKYSDKQFLRCRLKNGDLQKQLQCNIVICNNENIINQRNLNIRKRKRQVDQLKKSLFKKQKIQLQKQLFVMIPMVQKFNLMAKEMNRSVQGKIQIQYRNFSHYEIIEALKNFTKSKWKKDSNFSNVQIRIAVANLEQAKIYKWPVQVFKNRFQISQQIFQKYIQSSQSGGVSAFNIDKSKDPFWDPIDFVPAGVAYLSLECLLYDVDYEGEISFVHDSNLIAKAFVSVIPVKVKKRVNGQEQAQSVVLPDRPENECQIFNPRNFIQSSLYFTLSIQSLTFLPSSRESSPPLKLQLSYELLVDEYKNQTYTTSQIQFKSYEQTHQMNYLRRHLFNEVSQSTLAYISDCPIKFSLNLMKDYSQQCLNSSFNQDLQKSVGQTSLMNTSISSDLTSLTKQLQTPSYQTPEKSTVSNTYPKKPDFSKKQNKPVIYQNSELMDKIDKDCQEEDKKRKEKRRKLKENQAELKNRKEKLKRQDKDCSIY